MVDAVILNDKFALESKFGLMFQTTTVQLAGGYEDRNQDWPEGKFRFEVELKNRPVSEIQAFDAFLMGRRGAARSFLVRHPLYHTLTDENIGTGDGTTATYQVRQTISDAVNSYIRYWYTIQNLVVKVNGVTKTLTTDYTESNGLITFGVGDIPSAGQDVTVSGSTYVRVRFVEDYNPIVLPMYPSLTNAFASAGPFQLIEVPG
jgi:uncharacterized protein (TIGR02217 family)